jgi:hypothetical protein
MYKKYIFLPLILLFGLLLAACNSKNNNPVTPAAVGSIFVSSTPDSAQIWLDSTNTGKITPDTLTNINVGTHAVILKLAGYFNDSVAVVVKEGSIATLNRTLISNTGPGTITITSPKAGDVYTAGSTVNIKWISTGIQNVKIEFTTDNGLLSTDWSTLVNSTPSIGIFVTTFSIPSNQYRIRISEAVTGSPVAYSDGAFTILPQLVKTISMIAPNGGEHWIVGTTNEIRWVSANMDSVNIDYSLDGGSDWKNIATNVPSNGFYNWLVPVVAFRSDNCLIRVSDVKQGTAFAVSQAAFSIYPSKVLKWVFPNGGEIFVSTAPFPVPVIWLSSGIDSVNIDYTNNMGISWSNVVSHLPSKGVYNWIVPVDTPTSMARLRITDSSDPTITDISDDNFFIDTIPPIKLLTPVSNNIFSASSGMNISWKSNAAISSVKIEYSPDNGKSWNIISDSVPCTPNKVNIYLWNGIPNGIKGNILIKVSDSKGRYSDKSGKIIIN